MTSEHSLCAKRYRLRKVRTVGVNRAYGAFLSHPILTRSIDFLLWRYLTFTKNHYGRSRSQRQLIQRTIGLRFDFWGSFWVFQKIKISDWAAHKRKYTQEWAEHAATTTKGDWNSQCETMSTIVPKTTRTILGVSWVVGNMRGVTRHGTVRDSQNPPWWQRVKIQRKDVCQGCHLIYFTVRVLC